MVIQGEDLGKHVNKLDIIYYLINNNHESNFVVSQVTFPA